SSQNTGTQTCELPFGTFILAEWVPKNARRRDSRKVLPAHIPILLVVCMFGQQAVNIETDSFKSLLLQ
ncbi:MAG: hypothetical protein NTX75_01170, partial [Proteobacteria bacterium]|nr:hypothetical protein [Pseudomonadota bacterium]